MEKWARGEGKKKIIFYPATIQDGGIEPINLAYRSEITPALQAKKNVYSSHLICPTLSDIHWLYKTAGPTVKTQ